MNSRLDINPCSQIPRPPHLASGNKIQQLTTNAENTMTCVYQGVKNKLPIALRLPTQDQLSDRFKNPMPPNPPPTKFAAGLFGATQHRKARDESIGKTYSGRNCQMATARRVKKNTFICRRDTGEGNSRWRVWVSNSAVWHRLDLLVGLSFRSSLYSRVEPAYILAFLDI